MMSPCFFYVDKQVFRWRGKIAHGLGKQPAGRQIKWRKQVLMSRKYLAADQNIDNLNINY